MIKILNIMLVGGVLTFFLTGCEYSIPMEEVAYRKIILEDNKEEASNFVLQLVESGKNTPEARKTAIEIYGTSCTGLQMYREVSFGRIPIGFLPYHNCSQEQQERIDNWLTERKH